MKRLLIFLCLLCPLLVQGYGSIPTIYGGVNGGGGGGTTVIVSNNAAVGPLASFSGGFSNQTIVASGQTASIFPLSGAQLGSGLSYTNSMPIPAGTYTLNVFVSSIASLNGGTNLQFNIGTNVSGSVPVSSGYGVLISNAGITTNASATGTFKVVETNLLGCMMVSANNANATPGIWATWTLMSQVPTSTAGVSVTNVNVNTQVATNALNLGGVPADGYFTQPTNAVTYFVATNGNTATAIPNDPSHPYSPIFCDSTGTNFPGTGQAVDLATNGQTIYLEPGTYSNTPPSFEYIHLHPGVVFRGHNSNDTCIAEYNVVTSLGIASIYSFLQLTNNDVIDNLRLDAIDTGIGYGSWFLGEFTNFTGVVCHNDMVQGCWDTFYYNYSGNYSNTFSLSFYSCSFNASWDIASLGGFYGTLNFYDCDYYGGGNAFGGSRILSGVPAIWNDFGGRFHGFGQGGSGANNGYVSGIFPHGSIFENNTVEFGPNAPYALLLPAQAGGNGDFINLDTGQSFNLSGALPSWLIYQTNYIYATNFDWTRLMVTESGGGGGGFGNGSEYQITNTLPWVYGSTALTNFAVWTNGATGTAARMIVLNDPTQTNADGQGILTLESNKVDLTTWYAVGLQSAATDISSNLFASDIWMNSGSWVAIIGSGTATVYPFTNSISTNISAYLQYPSVFNGAVVSNSTGIVFTPPIFGNAVGLTNIANVSGFLQTNIMGAITGTNDFVYTVPANTTNSYLISGYLTVTALSLDVVQPKVVWTDENATVQTANLGSSISATGYNNLPCTFIRAKGGTQIFVTNALTTGTGSITYDTEVHFTGVSNNK